MDFLIISLWWIIWMELLLRELTVCQAFLTIVLRMQTPGAARSHTDMAAEESPCVMCTTGKKEWKLRITYPKLCPCQANSLARTSWEATQYLPVSSSLVPGKWFCDWTHSPWFPLLGDVFDIFLHETLLLISGGQGANCDIFDEELAKDNEKGRCHK